MSRIRAWINLESVLATQMVCDCLVCPATKSKLCKKWMGDLPQERDNGCAKTFTAICLNLMGPVTVKSMVNKGATNKVWPIGFMCQVSGAMCIDVAH